MERLNVEGSDAPATIMRPHNLTLDQLKNCDTDHIVDIRDPLAYASAYLPHQ